jgi:hypothetical protein
MAAMLDSPKLHRADLHSGRTAVSATATATVRIVSGARIHFGPDLEVLHGGVGLSKWFLRQGHVKSNGVTIPVEFVEFQ